MGLINCLVKKKEKKIHSSAGVCGVCVCEFFFDLYFYYVNQIFSQFEIYGFNSFEFFARQKRYIHLSINVKKFKKKIFEFLIQNCHQDDEKLWTF